MMLCYLKTQHRALKMLISTVLSGLVLHRVAWASIPSDWRDRFDPETLAIQEAQSEWHNLHADDIILDEDEADFFRNPVKYSGRLGKDNYWPNNGRGIPYTITHSDVHGKQKIEDVLAIIEKRTGFCITFEPRSQESEYIRFQPGRRCASHIGRQTGHATPVILGTDCLTTDVILHEILHALGFFHEQNRPDRDDYIDIEIENIRAEIGSINYEKLPEMVTYSLPYDFNSIMHYGPFNMSRISGRPTIVPKRGRHRMGQTHGLSILDVARLQLAYNCSVEHLASERSAQKYPRLIPVVSHGGERSHPETPAIHEGESGQHNGHGHVNLTSHSNRDRKYFPTKYFFSSIFVKYWPNNGQEIPYAINYFDIQGRDQIENALRIIEKRTGFCITFKERSNQTEYIRFQARAKRICAAGVGRTVGHATKVYLHRSCTLGEIQHEILHALGFFHENTRRDRDEHIDINFDNIREEYRHNYLIYPGTATYGLPYDFNSIMHVGPFDIRAKNPDLPVIVAKRGPQNMGQRQGLSILDVKRLQLAYNCPLGSSLSQRLSEGDAVQEATLSPLNHTTSRGNSQTAASSAHVRSDHNAVYVRVIAELKKLTNDEGLTIIRTKCDTWGLCDPIFKVYLDNERASANSSEARNASLYTEIYREDNNNRPNLPRIPITRDFCGIHGPNAVLRVLVEDHNGIRTNDLINHFHCRIDSEPAQTETVATWHDGVCTARKQRDKMKLTFRYKIFVVPRHRCVPSSEVTGGTTTKRRH